MARATQSQDIDGTMFAVSQLPAMRSMRLMHRLAKAVGPALLKAAGGKAVSLKELDLSNAGEAAQMLFETFSENDFETLIRELLESATVEHEGRTIPLMPVFDVVMAGKPGTILKLLKFALEVNYGSFFGGFLGSVGQLAGKA